MAGEAVPSRGAPASGLTELLARGVSLTGRAQCADLFAVWRRRSNMDGYDYLFKLLLIGDAGVGKSR